MDESELIARLRRRESQALRYLYDRYAGALFGVILRIVKSQDVAQEVLQDVMMKIWERFDQYDESKGRLFTWMVNISRNQAIDKTRSKEISQVRKTSDLSNFVHSSNKGNFLELSVDGIGVRELLSRLPADQQQVVDYLYFQGYTHSEMAEETGIPLGTVKTRLRSAMEQLRTLMRID